MPDLPNIYLYCFLTPNFWPDIFFIYLTHNFWWPICFFIYLTFATNRFFLIFLFGGPGRVVRKKLVVWLGSKARTSGGLTKVDMIKNKRNKIVSKKQSEAGKKAYQRLASWNVALLPRDSQVEQFRNKQKCFAKVS